MIDVVVEDGVSVLRKHAGLTHVLTEESQKERVASHVPDLVTGDRQVADQVSLRVGFELHLTNKLTAAFLREIENAKAWPVELLRPPEVP